MSEGVRMERLRWPAVAEELGFRRTARGRWAKNGSLLAHENGWLALRLARDHHGDPLRDLPGRPGLWRGLRQGDRVRHVHEIPPLVELEPDERDGRSTLRKLVHWADATLHWADATWTGLPGGEAEAPPPEEVESWLPAARRQIQVGSQLAQIELEVGPARLALAIPALWRIPAGLGESRRIWIEEILHDTQERFRMARLGIDDDAGCVCAEVDLTGAPPTLARPLLELGLAALIQAARGALPALAAAGDPAVHSQLLDRQPGWAKARPHQREGGEA